jgi:hypothetical protein
VVTHQESHPKGTTDRIAAFSRIRTLAHSVNQTYNLANWPELNDLAARAAESMGESHRRDLTAALDGRNGATVSGYLQVGTTDERRSYTLSELCQSSTNETSQQRIDPQAVEGILFGADGMIRRAGGGRAPHLMEDIEVAFIVKPSLGLEIGPIITSGRNRLMAAQILIKAAAKNALLDNVRIRCTTIHLPDRDSVERRIVAANMGSRNMAQAEVRERRAGGAGLNVSSRAALEASLLEVNSNKVYPAAFGALVKLHAIDQNLNGLTLDQYAATGVTVFNSLVKANKTLNKSVDTNTGLLVKMADCACSHIAAALPQVHANNSRGSKSGKLAKILVRRVAEQFELAVGA